VQCPACAGRIGIAACGQCAGAGWIEAASRQSAEEDSFEMPEALHPWAEFVRAWSMVERFGVQGWLMLTGRRARELDPDFGQTLAALGSELERLEFEDDVARARREHERSEAQRRTGK
jgi:hypothetical protein